MAGSGQRVHLQQVMLGDPVFCGVTSITKCRERRSARGGLWHPGFPGLCWALEPLPNPFPSPRGSPKLRGSPQCWLTAQGPGMLGTQVWKLVPSL